MKTGIAALMLLAASIATATTTGAQQNDLLLPGGNSKEPVSIESDILVYSDKDARLIYSGNVIVIQGDTRLNCTVLTLIMDKGAAAAPVDKGDEPSPKSTSPTSPAEKRSAPSPKAASAAASADRGNEPSPRSASPAASGDNGGMANANSQLKHMDCQGPVRIFSKTQTATGDSAAYDKIENKFWIIGNVTLSDGPNVTKGDKLTYDLTKSSATIETGGAKTKTRVQSLFVPNSTSGTK
jgi:lipopolysaccharide export system protein LptA